MKKYQIEKILHEIIRDLPEAGKMSRSYDIGLIRPDECLEEIARIIREERKREFSE